jgi:hypothetical protein
MTRRALSLALAPMMLGAQLVSAEAQTPAPPARPATTVPAQPVVEPTAQPIQLAADPVDAGEVRDKLHDLLRQYPPSLAEVLRLDPSLLTSENYLATYPALRAFLAQHPEVVRNPAYFVGTEHVRAWEDFGPRAEAVRVWSRVVEGFQIMGIITVITGAIVWLVKALIDHRRWLRQSKTHTEVHTKLLERFTNQDDLLAYIQSPTGRRFLESAPISVEADSPARPVGAPFGRIFWSVQAGTVLLLTGLGLQFVGQRQQWEEIAHPLWSMGILVVAVGLGFLISAGASYFLSRRLGLLPEYNGKNDVTARHDAL